MDYEQALSVIHASTRLGSRLGLERMTRLCKLLGRPQDKLRFVHIAGTNGKGSTAAMTAGVLQRAGKKTGLFISPYVVDFRERMQIDGEMIPKEELAREMELMLPVLEQMKAEGSECTEFEIVTALALCWFARRGCDAVAFEVGLGGRLDCTNVIDAPACCAILSISLDHTEFLGSTTGEIAREKCGILKRGTRAAVYPLLPRDAREMVDETCRSLGIVPNTPDLSRLTVLESGFDGSRIRYKGEEYFISLRGEHQIYNALTVLSIFEELNAAGWGIAQEDIRWGIAHTCFGGRLEVVRQSPLCMIDGAHNRDAVDRLCQAIDRFYAGRAVTVVMGMLADKEYEYCVEQVARRARRFFASRPASPRALDPAVTAEIAREHCADVRVVPDPAQAAAQAVALAGGEDVVIACGSLYMIGDCKKAMQDQRH